MHFKIKSKAKEERDEAWARESYIKATQKLTKKPTKKILKKFKQTIRPKSTVIGWAKTSKIGLRDYLYRIRVDLSPECLCGYKRQTI